MNAAGTAAVLFSTALRVPLAGPTAERLTGEPRLTRELLDAIPCLVARPARRGPAQALVFANGAHRDGVDEPYAHRGLTSLARAGFLVVAPDLPGLREGEITPTTVEALTAVTASAAQLSDSLGGRVVLLGACTGAGLALLSAADQRVARRVSAVFGIAPFADLRNILRLATTGWYRDDGGLHPYPVEPLLRCAAARSLVLALDPSPSRDGLLAALPAEPGDVPRRSMPEVLTPDATAVALLLANRDPHRFDELFAALPADVRRTIRRLSPIAGAHRLTARVELATGPCDRYFPISETRALERANRNVRVTVTSTLDHARPKLAAGDIVDLARFAGLVGRFARLAAGDAG